MIEKLAKLQREIKKFYKNDNVIIHQDGVQVFGQDNFINLAIECDGDIKEKDRATTEFPTKATFTYKGVEFYTIY